MENSRFTDLTFAAFRGSTATPKRRAARRRASLEIDWRIGIHGGFIGQYFLAQASLMNSNSSRTAHLSDTKDIKDMRKQLKGWEAGARFMRSQPLRNFLLFASIAFVVGGCAGLFNVSSELLTRVRERSWSKTASVLYTHPYTVYYHGLATPARDAQVGAWRGRIKGDILAIRSDKHSPGFLPEGVAGWGLSGRMLYDGRGSSGIVGSVFDARKSEGWWTTIVGSDVSIVATGKLQFHGPAFVYSKGGAITGYIPPISELVPSQTAD